MKRCVLASFDVLPSAKGAAQHILCNANHLQSSYHVSLLTLGQHPLYGWRHYPLDIPIRNWLQRGTEFHQRCTRIFQKNDFDIYHVRSPWEGLAVPEGKQIIYEVNGLASIEMPYHYPKMIEHPRLRQKLRTMELALLERASAIIVTNPITKSYLLDLEVPTEKIHTVPNTPSFGVSITESKNEIPQLCYIGTLSRWQGLYNAIRGLEKLVNVDFHLSILCPNKGRREFEKWVSKRDISKKISFHPTLAKQPLFDFLCTQDIGLAPLTPCERNLIQGCMPIKVLDYMAVGLSVVCSDIPVTRHLLGNSGYFYRPYSTDSFCQAVHDAIAHRHPEYRIENHNRIATSFSSTIQKQYLLSVYQQIRL